VAIVFALPRLFDAVVARFELEATLVPQMFGWQVPSEQMQDIARITWTPGDVGGGLGTIVAPKYPGRNPRSLATIRELCTVEITAFDPDGSSDERRQYQAARELLDAWLRAVHLAAVGTYQILSSTWVGGDRGRRMGATIRVVLAVDAPVLDLPIAVAPAVTAAGLTVRELNVTETQDLAPASPAPP
jgi:hypothetical protein